MEAALSIAQLRRFLGDLVKSHRNCSIQGFPDLDGAVVPSEPALEFIRCFPGLGDAPLGRVVHDVERHQGGLGMVSEPGLDPPLPPAATICSRTSVTCGLGLQTF
jgi:hypothetical protein